MTVQYDPNTAALRQVNPWSCSIVTATAMLHSIGDWVSAGDLQDVLVPQYVTPALGLLQGDGSGLAAFLEQRTGLTAHHAWLSWDDVCARAGQGPLGMGSPALYHWVMVRKVNEDGTLALDNPAPGYQGVYDTMTREQFDAWGPWAGVWLDMPASEEEDALSAEERAELDEYHQIKPYYDTLLGTADAPGGLVGAALDQMVEAAGTSKTHLATVVREQASAIKKAAGLD